MGWGGGVLGTNWPGNRQFQPRSLDGSVPPGVCVLQHSPGEPRPASAVLPDWTWLVHSACAFHAAHLEGPWVLGEGGRWEIRSSRPQAQQRRCLDSPHSSVTGSATANPTTPPPGSWRKEAQRRGLTPPRSHSPWKTSKSKPSWQIQGHPMTQRPLESPPSLPSSLPLSFLPCHSRKYLFKYHYRPAVPSDIPNP